MSVKIGSYRDFIGIKQKLKLKKYHAKTNPFFATLRI